MSAGKCVGVRKQQPVASEARVQLNGRSQRVLRHPDAHGRGCGTALYTALFTALEREDVHTIVAGVSLPNEASISLHERFGFRPVGVFHAVGRKFDKY